MTDNTGSSGGSPVRITIERDYDTSVQDVWDLWTTKEGIESWWAPDGFEVQVRELDLRPSGELHYAMTATGPEQIEFMNNAGMPLTTESRKTFTEVVPAERLGYLSLADFIPGVEPYEFTTVVELQPVAEGVHVIMTVDAMHEDQWTQRLLMGRKNELDNLAKVIAGRGFKSAETGLANS
jgi:uncharacterized protein YndB with AHSA1/START domain